MKYLKLIRLEQWHKNLIVFLPYLIFDGSNSLSFQMLTIAFLGFCATSSLTYIINDYTDKEKDKLHPIKKHRPIAAGIISKKEIAMCSSILIVIVSLACSELGLTYALILSTYFILTNLYSFGLKNIPVLDISMIAFNFVLRSMSGMDGLFNLNQILFLSSIFVIIIIYGLSKRSADIALLGDQAVLHKPVLKFYTANHNKIILIFAYLILFSTFYFIELESFNTWKKLALAIWILSNSFLINRDHLLAIQPHKLIKNPIWIVISLLMILVFYIS